MVTESHAIPAVVPAKELLPDPREMRTGGVLTERDYVLRALDFANTTDAPRLHALQTVLISGKVIPDPLYFHALHAPLTDQLLTVRAQFVARLDAITDSGTQALFDLASTIYWTGQRIEIRPTFLVTTKGVEVHYRHIPADLDAALGYVLMLILDSKRPYGRDLCRCKISECHKFFLAIKPKTGRPRRDYCCQAHLEASRNLTGARRVQDYRRRQKAKTFARPRNKPTMKQGL